MFSVFFFTILAVSVFSAEIPCIYEDQPFNYLCNLPADGARVLVTAENEPIEVTGTHIATKGNDDVVQMVFSAPHTLNFVPTKLFETFKNLQYFQMNEVLLSTMTTNAFVNCLKMETITISDNNFPILPASFAESCVNLRVLNFYQNWIETVDKDAFKGLAKLEVLTLNRNKFTFLEPATFTHSPLLSQLQVNDGKLLSIHPETFAALSLLRFVGFQINEISSLPALKFGGIKELQALAFERNKIAEIDPEILNKYPGNRDQFYILLNENVCASGSYSMRNQLSELQPCFDAWKQQHPAMTTLSTKAPCQSCGSHTTCRYFLDHNKVYSCVLENVELVLESIGGEHETIEGKTYTDVDVKAVYFIVSTLCRIPAAVFEKFPSIEFLSIPKSQMTIIDENTFEFCGNLKRLDVSNNKITKITESSLMKCQSLETINLSGNPIEDFNTELFKLDPQLKHVILNQKSNEDVPNVV